MDPYVSQIIKLKNSPAHGGSNRVAAQIVYLCMRCASIATGRDASEAGK